LPLDALGTTVCW